MAQSRFRLRLPQANAGTAPQGAERKPAADWRIFAGFLIAYGLVVAVLAQTGAEKFEHLHLLLDTSNGVLSLLLAMFLLAEQHRMEAHVRMYFAIGFAFAAATEILHALVGIEWAGSMGWIAEYSHTLRPATWPPSAYVLPLALAWTHGLIRRQSTLRPSLFAAGMALLTLCLFALSLRLPKYVDTGILGIQRPTQAPLLLLLAAVVAVYWRRRQAHPLYQGIAMMGVLLFLSDLCMLYSTSPHEKFTMMAHAGKLFAYALLHTIQMRVAAGDSQARGAAEAALFLEKERLRTALDELKYQKFALDQHAIVSVTDTQGTLIYANRRFCNSSGYAREELLGNNIRLLNSGVHPQEFYSDIYATIATAAVWSGEICNRAKDERLYWVITTVVPFLDDRNRASQCIWIQSDITPRKQAEQELLAAKEAAEAANRSKSAFLATMSHEIRTPMNGVLGMAQLLLMPGVSEAERHDYARTILNSGQTLLTLLNDILDLSKVEAGKFELARTAFEPRQLLDETAALFVDLAQAKGLQVDVGWRGPAGQRYWGDPVRLRQMLSNFLSNAVKFTAHGYIRLDASEAERTADASVLEFSVTDSGIGIPADRQFLLFQPFSQVDSSTTREYGGTGLGLSIVRSLAKLMGGSVGVDSTPGQGSRFWFRVQADLLKEGEDCREGRLRAEDEGPLDCVLALGKRVLVAEDNRTNRIVVEALLARLGTRAESVANGQEAVAAATGAARPDLVLMDVQMPLLDGVAATQQIRRWESDNQQPRLPIIALTAGAFDEDRQLCLASGMDDFLTKPVEMNELAAALGRWLRKADAAN